MTDTRTPHVGTGDGPLADRVAARLVAAAVLAATLAALVPAGGPPRAVLFLVSFAPLTVMALDPAARRSRRGATDAPQQRSGPWQWGGFGLCAVLAAQYLWIAAGSRGSYSPDAAYYFGVARHMVETGAFEEPIVWHWLAPPDAVRHPPFDYWGGLTSLALVPALALAGPSPAAAAVSVALVSGLGLFAFWWLVSVAVPLRSAAAQLFALLAFAWSPAVAYYRHDAESVPFAMLLLLLALVALAARRLRTATWIAFLLIPTRGDAAFACAAVWMAAVAIAAREGARRLTGVSLLMAGCVAAYVTYHLFVFGAPAPPAARLAPYLQELAQLLRFGEAPSPSPAATFALLSPGRWLEAARVAATTLLDGRLVPLPWLWLALVALACLRALRQREPVLLVCTGLATLGALLIPLASLPVHVADLSAGAASRGLMILVPVLALMGGVGLDAVLRGLRNLPLPERALPVLRAALIGALALACLADVRPYGWRRLDRDHRHYAAIARRTGGETVATDRPYWVIANTRSPALSIPNNGGPALEDVIDRYRPGWLLIPESPSPAMLWQGTPGEALVRAVYRGTRTAVGPYRLEPAGEFAGLRLFRIVGGAQRPP